MRLEVGQQAPEFNLPTDDNESVSLESLKGKKAIFYFYPKDDTPGCTKEACAFRDELDSLTQLGVEVIGVSPDSHSSHDKFRAKYNLNFKLASDEDHSVAESYGAWGEKNMYGKKFMGLIRSTFVIDEEGKIAKTWYNARVKDHVAKVKEFVESMS
jgi:peroxiredoxin Q/BCP